MSLAKDITGRITVWWALDLKLLIETNSNVQSKGEKVRKKKIIERAHVLWVLSPCKEAHAQNHSRPMKVWPQTLEVYNSVFNLVTNQLHPVQTEK